MRLKPLLKKINTRGRKREARRWLSEHERRCAPIRPLTVRSAAWLQGFDELKARDPVLDAAVTELIWADMGLGLSDEQWRAKEQRRREKLKRTWAREHRLRARHGAGATAA